MLQKSDIIESFADRSDAAENEGGEPELTARIVNNIQPISVGV